MGLLRLCRDHAAMVEADLQEFYSLDYCDRWRKTSDGRPLLTLRKLAVLIRGLPPHSRLAQEVAGHPYWTIEAQLLDDLRMAMTGTKKNPPEPHPSRPKPRPAPPSPERLRALADARQRARQHRARHGKPDS